MVIVKCVLLLAFGAFATYQVYTFVRELRKYIKSKKEKIKVVENSQKNDK